MNNRIISSVCAMVVSFLMIVSISKGATAEFRVTGNWNVASNWKDSLIPTSANYVYFNRAGLIGTINTADAVADQLWVGLDGVTTSVHLENGGSLIANQIYLGKGGEGSFVQSGGSVSLSSSLSIGRDNGTGEYTQSGGTASCGGMYIGRKNASQYGVFNISGGTMGSSGPMYCGYDGTGIVNQTEGEVVFGSSITVGHYATSYGEYNISGGNIYAGNNFYVGYQGVGKVVQTGGTNTVKTACYVGRSTGAVGTYNLQGGTLALTNGADLYIAFSATTGEFNLGIDSTGNGKIVQTPTNTACRLYVGGNTSVAATFRGFGNVELTDYFYMDGRVIGDGYGADKTLDFSTLNRQIQTVTQNPTNGINGWYAQNHGKVVLPAYGPIDSGTVRNWGENPSDSTIDLVNSARVTFNNINNGGSFVGALLAPDRTDINVSALDDVIAVWDFSGVDVGSGNVDIEFRYDHNAITNNGYAIEEQLKIFHYTSGKWSDVTTSIDMINKLITVDAAPSLGLFAAVVPVPPSGTFIVIR